MENASERIPHRSSISKRALLSIVARTSAYELVAQEHCGVPNGTEGSPTYQNTQKTTKSALLLSLKICGNGEGAEHLQCHRTSKRSSSSNTLNMHEQVDEKQQAAL